MRTLSLEQISHVAGGDSLSVYFNSSLPLTYLPVIENYINNAENLTFKDLIKAITDAGLDPNTILVSVDVSYYLSSL